MILESASRKESKESPHGPGRRGGVFRFPGVWRRRDQAGRETTVSSIPSGKKILDGEDPPGGKKQFPVGSHTVDH